MNEDVKTIVEGMLSDGKWQKMHEQSRRVYSIDGIAPTLHTCGGGNLEPKIKELLGWSRDKKGKIVNRHTVSVANCITSSKRDNTQNFVKEYNMENEIQGVYLHDSERFSNPPLQGMSRCIKSEKHDAGIIINETGKKYRIRKLTERECFRLMGVDDKDIDTIQASGVSKSQQYKMAGNSIVVDVLYHIFRKMFTETQNENRQLTLF